MKRMDIVIYLMGNQLSKRSGMERDVRKQLRFLMVKK